MSRKDWPQSAWAAINALAELDLAHYPNHVHNREAFLGKARTERVLQHQSLIDALVADDPYVTVEQLVAACNPQPLERNRSDPEWAKRRDYDWQSVPCEVCDSAGRVPVMQDVERWALCPACEGRRIPA
jgi:hypothetical protein